MSDLEKWASDSGPFADNTRGAITAKTFRDFAAAVDAALEEADSKLMMVLASYSGDSDLLDPSSLPAPFVSIDPDNPDSGDSIASKAALDSLGYEGEPWGTGQFIRLKTGWSYFWDGSSWVNGQND